MKSNRDESRQFEPLNLLSLSDTPMFDPTYLAFVPVWVSRSKRVFEQSNLHVVDQPGRHDQLKTESIKKKIIGKITSHGLSNSQNYHDPIDGSESRWTLIFMARFIRVRETARK
jgi:hypothetical protein